MTTILIIITLNLPTKVIPAEIRRLGISGKFPMDVRIPPLEIDINCASVKPSEIRNLGAEILSRAGSRSGTRASEEPVRSPGTCTQ